MPKTNPPGQGDDSKQVQVQGTSQISQVQMEVAAGLILLHIPNFVFIVSYAKWRPNYVIIFFLVSFGFLVTTHVKKIL